MLSAALDRAGKGRGSLFLLAGEPGIGKSRLADEFAGLAQATGARKMWGRCWEGAGAPPYWPWIQALRGYLREVDSATVRELLGTGAVDLAQMLPEIREIVPELPQSPVESDSARFQLFDSTTTLIGRISDSATTVIVLDDLHAADTPSVMLLRFLATQLHAIRVVIVATFRDVELTPDHALTRALAELGREPVTQHIALRGLDQVAASQLIEATAGIPAADRLSREIWRETKGNPLFLGEATRLLISERRFGGEDSHKPIRLSVPAGVRAVISRRLEQLSPETVSSLTVGAAIGPEFSIELVARIAGQPMDAVGQLLVDAERAGLVRLVSTAPGYMRFDHDLIRESLYEGVPSNARADLHQQIAEALEHQSAGSMNERLAELAYHYFEAARGRSDDQAAQIARKAYDYAERAGQVALSALAYEEAARLFRSALDALELTGRGQDDVRGRLLLAVGEAESRTGDQAAAQRSFLAAASIYRGLGDARNLAVAALGYSGRVVWARAGRDTAMIPLLREALELLGGADQLLSARLMTRLACAQRSSPDQRTESDRLSREALETARTIGDSNALGEAMIGRYYATFWPENHEERAILAREAVAVAEEAGDPELLVEAYLIQWLSDADGGKPTIGRSTLDDLTRVARELRQPAKLWLGVGPKAQFELMLGNFEAASELIDRELDAPYPFSYARDNESAGSFHRFLLHRETSDLAAVESGTRAAAHDFPWYPLHRVALALLLVETGKGEEARQIFDALASESFSALYRDNEWLLGMALASEVCYLLNERDAAEVLYDQLSPFAGRHAIGHSEGSMGALDRYLGLLALTLGNRNRAIAHLRAAVELNEQLGARPWTARSKHDLALALDGRGSSMDGARANTLRHEALETAQALGMAALEAQLLGELGLTQDGLEPGRTGADGLGSDVAFQLEGEYWTIRFSGHEFLLRDAKGLRYLSRLLQSPGREILALDLVQEASFAPEAHARHEPDLPLDGLGDAGPALDNAAKQAYRERVQELREELDQAESWNDPERASRAREEIDFITRELAAAVGIGGRDRPSASPGERARVSVTRAIRLSMARIAQNSEALGAHLEATIHTGTYCVYRPDPRVPIEWHL